MKHMSLQSPSEMELIGDGMSKSKAYQVCMLSILTAVIFLMKTFCFFLPIPVGLFALYIFRDFGEIVVKALYLKNVLVFLITIIFTPELIYLVFVVSLVLSDMGMGWVIIQDGFNFYNSSILKMSIITQIPAVIISTFVMAPILMVEMGIVILDVVQYLSAAIIAMGLTCVITGVATLWGFKLTLKGVEMIPNMININKGHVGF